MLHHIIEWLLVSKRQLCYFKWTHRHKSWNLALYRKEYLPFSLKMHTQNTTATWKKNSTFDDDLVTPHPSVRIEAGPRGLSLPGHLSSAVKGVLVSWERELQPSPDAEALPRDSVMSQDWRKCSVRAGEAGPGSPSAAWTAAGWETKSLGSFSEAWATCGIHLQQACEEWKEGGNMENSFVTHQDDREDYSVVHA